MSLVTVSTKRNRVYQRAFDHEQARALRDSDPEKWTYAELGRHFGVSPLAVRRVLVPEVSDRMASKAAEFLRNSREPCLGGCGALVWTHRQGYSGYCPACYGVVRTAHAVRDDELRCTRCGEWKPDDEFGRGPVVSRRNHRPHCRACETTARREHRKAHPEIDRASQDRAVAHRRAKRQEHIPMTAFMVLRRNGSGWIEHAQVDANSGIAAVEKAADAAGEYVAFSHKQVCNVEPVVSMKVVARAD